MLHDRISWVIEKIEFGGLVVSIYGYISVISFILKKYGLGIKN